MEMKAKNIETIKTLITVAYTDGNVEGFFRTVEVKV